MTPLAANAGISTIVNHFAEGENPHHAHVSPIYQTSTFGFPDVETGRRIFAGEQPGYIYSRAGNPNATQLARKYAYLEGLDLIRQHPDASPDEIVAGRVTASGMAAISSAIMGRVTAGQTVIVQRHLYGNAYRFFNELAPRLGIEVVWVDDLSAGGWEAAFNAHPDAVLAYAETPANPTMLMVDLRMVIEIAHAHNAWVMVDNTFATPYHQRPLSLGCDVVVHSTTKYLTGHGVVIGGAIVSTHLDYMNSGKDGIGLMARILGPAVSPFDAWLANLGLKTFELRMQRHAENGLAIARWLGEHPKVERVGYPGLKADPGHEIALKQMFNGFGGMVAFELKGGYDAGVALMNHVRLATLAVSLGNVDSLIQHPASMTHAGVPPEQRLKVGISDGLVRFSVGVENIADLIADLEQAFAHVG
ncbi:MAG TPA: aminotransferase class I/II-fold pyridoxal phosphate-dependent enzyme [Caldilineae bacterium]|nr:aminotransferase class I/II-fold pyridoxal phosphate-dependent enzyme [Caldilineae bacterium]